VDAAVLRAVAEYGLALVALIALAVVAYRWVSDQRADLRKQRDRSLTLAESAIAATDKLAEAVREQSEILQEGRARGERIEALLMVLAERIGPRRSR
jgi:hypothetical protein